MSCHIVSMDQVKQVSIYWANHAESTQGLPIKQRLDHASLMIERVHAANVCAWNERYNETEPVQSIKLNESDLTNPIVTNPVHIIRLISGINYQCSDWSGFDNSEANKQLRHTVEYAHYELPGYEAAPWSLDIADYKPDAGSASASFAPSDEVIGALITAVDMLASFLIDNTDDDFGELPEIDEARTLLQDVIEALPACATTVKPAAAAPPAVNVPVIEALVRGLIADAEGMRNPSGFTVEDHDTFGTFYGMEMQGGGFCIEWPNLAMLVDQLEAHLNPPSEK